MAVAYDNSSTAELAGDSSKTFSHTVTGSDLILIVFAFIDQTGNSVSSVTYNGENLTFLATANQSGNGEIEAWYLINPSTGANNVVLTMSAGSNGGVSATSLTGIDVRDPIRSYTTGTGATSSSSVTYDRNNSSSGVLVIDGLVMNGFNSGDGTNMSGVPSSSQTERLDFKCDQWQRGLVSTKQVTDGNTTMSWTLSGGTLQGWASVAIVLNPRRELIPPTKSLRPAIFTGGIAR